MTKFNLVEKVNKIAELKNFIDSLYVTVRTVNLDEAAKMEIYNKISLTIQEKESLINEINDVLAIANLTTRIKK